MLKRKNERGQAMAEWHAFIPGAILLAYLLGTLLAPSIQKAYCEILLPLNGGSLNSTDACVEILDLDCDQGRGNGDDLCVPANSNQNHDSNDPQDGNRK